MSHIFVFNFFGKNYGVGRNGGGGSEMKSQISRSLRVSE